MCEVPSITVVIAYHEEPKDFVRDCLASLLNQTFESWEGILVDDGSRNEIVSGVVKEMQDPRFKIIRHAQNRGLGAARNTGIRAAKAQLVALLDADDRLDPSFLEITHRALRDRPEADWVVVDWKCFGTTDEVWPFPIDDSLNCPAHFLFVGSGVLMRRRVWASVGGYSEEEALRGGEDWDFWIGVAERRLQPLYLAQPLYLYRIHPQAMTFTTARYDNYRFRKAIHARHQMAFRSMGMDCPQCLSPRARVAKFLAQGLAVSSNAFLDSGRRLKGVGLATRALLLQPGNPSYRKHFLRSLLPGGCRRFISRFRQAPRTLNDRTPGNS